MSEDEALVCPCGCGQQLDRQLVTSYRRASAGQPATVVVAIPAGVYRVPRLFIGIHGLAAQDLPAIAQRLGWEQLA